MSMQVDSTVVNRSIERQQRMKSPWRYRECTSRMNRLVPLCQVSPPEVNRCPPGGPRRLPGKGGMMMCCTRYGRRNDSYPRQIRGGGRETRKVGGVGEGRASAWWVDRADPGSGGGCGGRGGQAKEGDDARGPSPNRFPATAPPAPSPTLSPSPTTITPPPVVVAVVRRPPCRPADASASCSQRRQTLSLSPSRLTQRRRSIIWRRLARFSTPTSLFLLSFPPSIHPHVLTFVLPCNRTGLLLPECPSTTSNNSSARSPGRVA